MEALEALEDTNDNSVEFKTFGGKLKNQQWKKNDVGDGYFTLENVGLNLFLTAFYDTETSEPDVEIKGKPTLFYDLTRDSIANNFVTDIYCRCLQILYQIAFFFLEDLK